MDRFVFNQEATTNDFINLKVFQNLSPQIFSDFAQIDTKNQFFLPKKCTPYPNFQIFKFPNFQIFQLKYLCASAPLRETILHITISHSKSPILKSRSALRSIRVIRVAICIVGKTVTWIDVCSIRKLPRMMLYIQCYFKIFFHRLTQKTRFFAQKMQPIPQFSNFQIPEFSNLSAQIPLCLCAFARNI